ncbi:hypothetical protein BU17DRAFT_66554 [Hysterangium stoloniferum]|nr:hypothetical protein BU17DRAFT_66554 [Hysterangium stoloniferum]
MASRIKLPGYGLPIIHWPRELQDDHFKSALNQKDLVGDILNSQSSLPLTTLREFAMMQAMNHLTDKPDWHVKVFDDTITSKWKAELTSTEGADFTLKMADWCIAELQYKAGIFKTTGAISIYNGDVVKSDTAIPAELKEELISAVAPLEDVSDQQKDWHPNSDEKVLDIVHPSLFPLVYGRTRILPYSATNLDNCIELCGDGEVVSTPSDHEAIANSWKHSRHVTSKPYSLKFQWLPCDVDISKEDGSTIISYINNIHPQKHRNLYGVIEKFISHTIPLWNMTLTPLLAPNPSYPRISYTQVEYDPDSEEEGVHRDDYSMRRVVKPEPGQFAAPSVAAQHVNADPSVDLRRDFAQTGLQIIVKLANIHLTPEKTEYEGGTWHVEGQLNEHICATALYYYDSVNITTSRLAFRQQSNYDIYDIEYDQDEHNWLSIVFGCENEGPAVQYIGTVDTKEGRLLTFPNILQHQVQPFKLEDPTKPGHRKILALFLVDPNIRVISTANVPCQQRDWWAETLSEGKGCGLNPLPVELRTQIINGVEDFPISLKEAKELRLELMEERSHFVVDQTAAFEEQQFSLCEH